MGSEGKVLKYLKRKKTARGKEICTFFGFSRQNLNKIVRKLIFSGTVVKEGRTKGSVYKLTDKIKDITPRDPRPAG